MNDLRYIFGSKHLNMRIDVGQLRSNKRDDKWIYIDGSSLKGGHFM
jgi:hypothetical protein